MVIVILYDDDDDDDVDDDELASRDKEIKGTQPKGMHGKGQRVWVGKVR